MVRRKYWWWSFSDSSRDHSKRIRYINKELYTYPQKRQQASKFKSYKSLSLNFAIKKQKERIDPMGISQMVNQEVANKPCIASWILHLI